MRLIVVCFGLLVSLGACTSWRVLAHTDPCPYSDQRRFDVVDLTFEGVAEPPSEAFTSRRDAADKWREDEDRRVVRDGYLTSLMDEADEREITIRIVPDRKTADSAYRLEPRVTRLLPGGPTITDAVASEVEITIAVLDGEDRVVDEIAIVIGTDPSGEYFDRDRRLRRGAQLLGERTVKFLAGRLH